MAYRIAPLQVTFGDFECHFYSETFVYIYHGCSHTQWCAGGVICGVVNNWWQ